MQMASTAPLTGGGFGICEVPSFLQGWSPPCLIRVFLTFPLPGYAPYALLVGGKTLITDHTSEAEQKEACSAHTWPHLPKTTQGSQTWSDKVSVHLSRDRAAIISHLHALQGLGTRPLFPEPTLLRTRPPLP